MKEMTKNKKIKRSFVNFFVLIEDMNNNFGEAFLQ